MHPSSSSRTDDTGRFDLYEAGKRIANRDCIVRAEPQIAK